MEMFGVAESSNPRNKQDQEKLQNALAFLDRAYSIRFDTQGPKHVDTVSTLSRIGRVLAKLKKYEDARGCFYEVLKLREAIYGSHPCVACSAQALAVVHSKLADIPRAKHFFKYALKIHEENGLDSHSYAVVIRKELKDLKHTKERFAV
jgi:tetratricopeptide (TPR) repeat protein